jgi:hypothetical protein
MPNIGSRGVDLQRGEAFTLRASAISAATAGTNGTAVEIHGERLIYTFVLACTDVATDAGDTLNVYVDTLYGTATWINAVHFTQIIGTDANTTSFFATVMPENLGVSTAITTDCAAGVSRGIVGSQWRARWIVVDADANASFIWSLTAYAL